MSYCACTQGTFPTSNQLSCQSCDGTTGSFYDFAAGLAVRQSWRPSVVATSNQCVCSGTGPAGTTSLVAAASFNGTNLQRCVVCPQGTQVNTTGGGQACVPVNGALPTLTPLQQLARTLLSLGLTTITPAAATTVSYAIGVCPSRQLCCCRRHHNTMMALAFVRNALRKVHVSICSGDIHRVRGLHACINQVAFKHPNVAACQHAHHVSRRLLSLSPAAMAVVICPSASNCLNH